MIIDSHCHLNILPEDKVGNLDAVMAKAKELDVTHMLCIAIAPAQWQEILQISDQYPQVYSAIGVHPCEEKDIKVTDAELISAAQHPKVIAIGEVGLDYHHFDDKTEDMAWQQQRFRQHIKIAKQLNKPLIIHTRNSTADCLKILSEENAEQVGGIMHCFVEDLETAKKAMALNFYISFSGIITFKNAKELKEVAKNIPLDKILVETDSPYLSPTPYRGKTNQPGYTYYVVEELAKLRNTSVKEMAEITTNNFKRLFKLEEI